MVEKLPSQQSTNETKSVANARALEGAFKSTLGNKKLIMGAIRGSFDISRNEVENFHHLVTQRVKDQNEYSLQKFEVNIFYDDGSSIKLESMDEFRSYIETRALHPVTISFSWSYLLRFPESQNPEKQQVDIIVSSSLDDKETESKIDDDSVRLSASTHEFMIKNLKRDCGSISYSIEHSRITWGIDLENTIRNHINKIIIKPNGFESFTRKHRLKINIAQHLILWAASVYIAIKLIVKNTLDDMSASNTDLFITDGTLVYQITFAVASMIVLFVLTAALTGSLDKRAFARRPSFILLSDFDEKYKKKNIKIYERRPFAIFLAVTISVALSIFAAKIDALISKLI